MNQLKLKKVEQEDWNTLVLIRNDPIVRKASINESRFTQNQYRKYIENQLLQNKRNRHWIVMLGGKKIGHVKIINQELGYILAKNYRNQGLGSKILSLVCREAKKLGYRKVYDVVKVNQPIALWFAIKNGFKMISLLDKHSIPYAYKLEKYL